MHNIYTHSDLVCTIYVLYPISHVRIYQNHVALQHVANKYCLHVYKKICRLILSTPTFQSCCVDSQSTVPIRLHSFSPSIYIFALLLQGFSITLSFVSYQQALSLYIHIIYIRTNKKKSCLSLLPICNSTVWEFLIIFLTCSNGIIAIEESSRNLKRDLFRQLYYFFPNILYLSNFQMVRNLTLFRNF